jgi:hypothetical protein
VPVAVTVPVLEPPVALSLEFMAVELQAARLSANRVPMIAFW